MLDFRRVSEKTFKREFALVFGASWIGSFLYLVVLAPADRIVSLTPLINGTALPVLAFIAAAAGIHYMKPKAPKDAEK
jgi:hypothetical protein